MEDVRTPSRYTTFIIHCGQYNHRKVVSFESLNSKNQPSNYFLTVYDRGSIRAMPNIASLQDYRRFVIGRYIAPVLAIRSLQYMYVSNGKLLEKSKWVELIRRHRRKRRVCHPEQKFQLTEFPWYEGNILLRTR